MSDDKIGTDIEKITTPKADTRDRILTFYQDTNSSVELSDKDEEIRERWEYAFTLLCNHRSPMSVANILVKLKKISYAQAYRDIKACKSLFGDVFESSRKGQDHILHEMAIFTFRMAKRNGNINQMNRAVANLIKIRGEEDPDLPDFSILEANQYEINIPKEVLDMLTKLVDAGSVDVSQFLQQNTEDIDHEDVN